MPDRIRRRRAPEVRTVTPDDWSLLATLFGENGACGGCWCMHWRTPKGADWDREKGARNKRAFKQLVEAGAAHGCLAFVDGEPAGWCCFGPRGDFDRLQRSRVLSVDAAPDAWAVVCFFIPARFRKRGVGTALLRGAARAARAAGARCLEGYPARPKGGDYPATFAFTGVPRMFALAGFQDVTSPGASRLVFRRRFRRTGR